MMVDLGIFYRCPEKELPSEPGHYLCHFKPQLDGSGEEVTSHPRVLHFNGDEWELLGNQEILAWIEIPQVPDDVEKSTFRDVGNFLYYTGGTAKLYVSSAITEEIYNPATGFLVSTKIHPPVEVNGLKMGHSLLAVQVSAHKGEETDGIILHRIVLSFDNIDSIFASAKEETQRLLLEETAKSMKDRDRVEEPELAPETLLDDDASA